VTPLCLVPVHGVTEPCNVVCRTCRTCVRVRSYACICCCFKGKAWPSMLTTPSHKCASRLTPLLLAPASLGL
jgi:hypothetical protein